MFHIFHFLISDMNFEIVNPFSLIFYATGISREKSCLITITYIDVETVFILYVHKQHNFELT